MHYVLTATIRHEITNNEERDIVCPHCDGRIAPHFTHMCIERIPIPADLPGEIESIEYRKA